MVRERDGGRGGGGGTVGGGGGGGGESFNTTIKINHNPLA